MSGATQKQYYVLSLKHTRGDFILWWGPDRRGYARNLAKAGVYNEDEIAASRLNDGESTLAISCDEVNAKAWRVVHTDDIRELAKQPLYQTSDGMQTQKVYDRESARLKKEQEERKKKIAAGELCDECDGGRGEHNEWCSHYGEENDDD